MNPLHNPITWIRSTLTPDAYHGMQRNGPYFEGWYYKLVTQNGSQRWSIIPGVYIGSDPKDSHAFIQALNGVSGKSFYIPYPYHDFQAKPYEFDVHIADNHFSRSHLQLNLQHPDLNIQGELGFSGLTPWPVRLWSPGIMGWYAWVPSMECYHGIVSLDHQIQGSLWINEDRSDFSGGRGYIEKDWGQAMPRAWLWLQCNHFQDSRAASLTASIAVIPWRGRTFNGFIAGFWDGDNLHRFTTYNGGQLTHQRITENEASLVFTKGKKVLEIQAQRTSGSSLQAPTLAQMDRRIMETLSATVNLRLSQQKHGKSLTLFESQGHYAGMEVVGDLPDGSD